MILRRLCSVVVLLCFIISSIIGPNHAYAADAVASLPVPGAMVNLSPAFEPVLMKGIKINSENPFQFDFILDTGHTNLKATDAQLKAESERLIKYFLAAMTVPEKDLWVNLSPYEKNRMIADNLGQTDMGRDLLAQDYILKQLTASLIYPEKDLGKKFWDSVYAKAQQQFGNAQIPVNTFNKVWIVADKADVFERGNVAYVVGAHLKVMMEEDYLAREKHGVIASEAKQSNKGIASSPSAPRNDTKTITNQIIRDVIIPEIEKEVNQGQNFAPLRQMFYSMILASWYKMALKDAILTQIYGNQSKVKVGVNANDPTEKDQIFERYLQAYKKGVFNYIKEDVDSVSKQSMPRKYFSGGANLAMLANPNFLHRIRSGISSVLISGLLLSVNASTTISQLKSSSNLPIPALQNQDMAMLSKQFNAEMPGLIKALAIKTPLSLKHKQMVEYFGEAFYEWYVRHGFKVSKEKFLNIVRHRSSGEEQNELVLFVEGYLGRQTLNASDVAVHLMSKGPTGRIWRWKPVTADAFHNILTMMENALNTKDDAMTAVIAMEDHQNWNPKKFYEQFHIVGVREKEGGKVEDSQPLFYQDIIKTDGKLVLVFSDSGQNIIIYRLDDAQKINGKTGKVLTRLSGLFLNITGHVTDFNPEFGGAQFGLYLKDGKQVIVALFNANERDSTEQMLVTTEIAGANDRVGLSMNGIPFGEKGFTLPLVKIWGKNSSLTRIKKGSFKLENGSISFMRVDEAMESLSESKSSPNDWKQRKRDLLAEGGWVEGKPDMLIREGGLVQTAYGPGVIRSNRSAFLLAVDIELDSGDAYPEKGYLNFVPLNPNLNLDNILFHSETAVERDRGMTSMENNVREFVKLEGDNDNSMNTQDRLKPTAQIDFRGDYKNILSQYQVLEGVGTVTFAWKEGFYRYGDIADPFEDVMIALGISDLMNTIADESEPFNLGQLHRPNDSRVLEGSLYFLLGQSLEEQDGRRRGVAKRDRSFSKVQIDKLRNAINGNDETVRFLLTWGDTAFEFLIKHIGDEEHDSIKFADLVDAFEVHLKGIDLTVKAERGKDDSVLPLAARDYPIKSRKQVEFLLTRALKTIKEQYPINISIEDASMITLEDIKPGKTFEIRAIGGKETIRILEVDGQSTKVIMHSSSLDITGWLPTAAILDIINETVYGRQVDAFYSWQEHLSVSPNKPADDAAMNTLLRNVVEPKLKGGIDLDRNKMNMNVSKDAAMGGVNAKFDKGIIQHIQQNGFDGLNFKINSILPTSIPILLGLQQRKEDEEQKLARIKIGRTATA